MNRLILFSTLAILAQLSANAFAVTTKAYTPLGCWTDKNVRAMVLLEGKSDALKVHYKRRDNPVEKCYTAALENKMPVFGIQDGGQCFGSADAKAAKKYGASSACSAGKGGPMANSVYELTTVPKCLCLVPAKHKDALPAGKPCFDGLADVNAKNRTALHIAARYGYGKCTKTLIDLKANVEAVDADQKTPIQLAQWKSEEVGCGAVKALIQAQAKIDKLTAAEKARVDKCMREN